MNTHKEKQLDNIISFAFKLIPLVSCVSPNLAAIQSLCNAKYEEKIWEPGHGRRRDFIPKEDASTHLKATYLAVMVLDDMLADYFDIHLMTDAYLNPRHPQHLHAEAMAIALCHAIHNLHIFQQYHESRVTGSTLDLRSDTYETFAGWLED